MNPVAILAILLVAAMPAFGQATPGGYRIVDTSQTSCYDNTKLIIAQTDPISIKKSTIINRKSNRLKCFL